MKAIAQLLGLIIVLFCFSNLSFAQNMKTNAFKVYIQSDKDTIEFSQVDASCIKSREKKDPFVFRTSVESKITRVSPNVYELSVSPIKVMAPTIPKLIACNIELTMYVEPKIYLKFVILGSYEPMDKNELSQWIESPNKVTQMIIERFSNAKLFHAKYPQNYVLKLKDAVIANTYYN